ncbi:MAG: energy-coupling factor ABC transporter ATP-binding protein [Desulfovibrionaceae bacterium]
MPETAAPSATSAAASPAAPPLVELHDVHFAYPNGRRVLDGVDIAFGDRRVGLIGANGSGKTTLLHIIMGLLRPTRGEVRFRGAPLGAEKDFGPLRRAVGFVFQNADDQLFCPTVIEDVAFGPLNLGRSPAEAAAAASRTLERLGLGGFEERITHRLSGGEKRLVSLATVLAMEPEALLLDEPTNDLDPDTRHRLIGILQDLPQPFLVISHDWDFLAQVTGEVHCLEAGRLTAQPIARLHGHRHAHPAGDQPHHHHPDGEPHNHPGGDAPHQHEAGPAHCHPGGDTPHQHPGADAPAADAADRR